MCKSKLLLVDDEPFNLTLYEKMLKDFNFQIYTATNGDECIQMVSKHIPDLILMDWNMPVMDGITTLTILKENDATKNIPVLMITGVMTSSADLAYALQVGAVDFLKKPFDEIELRARIRNILLLSESLHVLTEQYQNVEDENIFITSLLDGIPHPVIYYSLEGTLLLCNKFFSQMLDIPLSVLIGNSVYQYLQFEEVDFHIQKDFELVQSRKAISYEKNVFPGNKIFIVSKNIVFDNLANPIGIIAAFTDISDLKKANDEIINTKKIELISSTLKFMHLNKLNSSLIDELEKVLPHASKEGQEFIHQIKHKFKMNMREQIWSDFETRFENAFDTFSNVLLQKFPNLTPSERKLCALLRSGLSSKDIAILTFQNSHSVDIARYRLRKKFNLVNEENLSDFLLLLDK